MLSSLSSLDLRSPKPFRIVVKSEEEFYFLLLFPKRSKLDVFYYSANAFWRLWPSFLSWLYLTPYVVTGYIWMYSNLVPLVTMFCQKDELFMLTV